MDALPLAERAGLTAGVDFWHLAPSPTLGLPSLAVTDGPNGARGSWGTATSACVPCGTALAATWDRDLVIQVGRLLGDETRAKGAGILLAPTVNMHRHPLAGRNFECFSEDPFLTAEIAVGYIDGVQSRGVGCAVKHFACNEQEHERMTISAEVDERALRETYLPPFEAAVTRAHVWAVMTAYNRLGGIYCSEHAELLHILKQEWGFDGVVVSDWKGTHSTAAITAGLDLEMPGPAVHLGEHLLDAVADGRVDQSAVDEAARRVAGLVARAAAEPPAGDALDRDDVARRAAVAGMVLLRNEHVLPFDRTTMKTIAVIGPAAARLAPQGGGSAHVNPPITATPVEAIAARAGTGVTIVHEPGCAIPGPVAIVDPRLLCADDEVGTVRVDWFAGRDFAGPVIETKAYRDASIFTETVGDLKPGDYSVRATTTLRPDVTGRWRFGLASIGPSRLLVDGAVLLDNTEPTPGRTFYGMGSEELATELHVEAGTALEVVAELCPFEGAPFGAVSIGAEPVLTADAFRRAVAAAATADAAVVIVGSDHRWETEGKDRVSMALPGEQDTLIHAVAAANPATVVVVNAGSPVSMDWADDVAAVLQLWYPGHRGAEALADVLFGDAEPGGRLPTTFPMRLEDVSPHIEYPGEDGEVRYREGLLVGYRLYDELGIEPRFCFGHGLGYTSFELGEPAVTATATAVRIRLDVANTGTRAGSEVVQAYVTGPAHPKALRAFAKVHVAAGASVPVELLLDQRSFAHWDTAAGEWRVEPGDYELLVGRSSRDIRHTLCVSRSASAR